MKPISILFHPCLFQPFGNGKKYGEANDEIIKNVIIRFTSKQDHDTSAGLYLSVCFCHKYSSCPFISTRFSSPSRHNRKLLPAFPRFFTRRKPSPFSYSTPKLSRCTFPGSVSIGAILRSAFRETPTPRYPCVPASASMRNPSTSTFRPRTDHRAVPVRNPCNLQSGQTGRS